MMMNKTSCVVYKEKFKYSLKSFSSGYGITDIVYLCRGWQVEMKLGSVLDISTGRQTATGIQVSDGINKTVVRFFLEKLLGYCYSSTYAQQK